MKIKILGRLLLAASSKNLNVTEEITATFQTALRAVAFWVEVWYLTKMSLTASWTKVELPILFKRLLMRKTTIHVVDLQASVSMAWMISAVLKIAF